MDAAAAPPLDIEGLSVTSDRRRGGRVEILHAIDLTLAAGETPGVVGESGCGKSTVGLALLHLVRAKGGTVRRDGTDLLALGGPELMRARRQIQIVFHYPYSSLNPRQTAADLIAEPLRMLGIGTRAKQGARRRAAGAGGARHRAGGALAAPVLGRPAPAHQHRARPRAGCGDDRMEGRLDDPRKLAQAAGNNQRSTCGARARTDPR